MVSYALKRTTQKTDTEIMKTNTIRLHTHSYLIALFLALAAGSSSANELTGSLSLGIGQSDNLRRTPDDQLDVGMAFR